MAVERAPERTREKNDERLILLQDQNEIESCFHNAAMNRKQKTFRRKKSYLDLVWDVFCDFVGNVFGDLGRKLLIICGLGL